MAVVREQTRQRHGQSSGSLAMDQEAHIPLTQDTTSLLELTTGGSTGDPALEDGRDLRGGCTRQVH